MLCANPLLTRCCPAPPGVDEITLIPASDHFEIPRAEVVLSRPQHWALDVSENPPKEEKLDMSHQIQGERVRGNSCSIEQIAVRGERKLSFAPEEVDPYFPTKIYPANVQPRQEEAYHRYDSSKDIQEYPAYVQPRQEEAYHRYDSSKDIQEEYPQPRSSHQALALMLMKEPMLLQEAGYIHDGRMMPELDKWADDVRGTSGRKLPELENSTRDGLDTAPDQIPRGDFILSEAADVDKVTGHDLLSMEQMVSKIAGSPLGCIGFGNTFRTMQQNNKILMLRGHSLEGELFGDTCAKYQRITMLAIKKSDGRMMWAPAPLVTLQSSDDILLIACTPFAMAMGMGKDSPLSTSALIPHVSPQVTREKDQDDFKPRRCCAAGVGCV